MVSYIENTNDVELLSLLKEDFVFYGKVKYSDITDSLSPNQLQELNKLAAEDDLENTQNLEEFKKATDTWRAR